LAQEESTQKSRVEICYEHTVCKIRHSAAGDVAARDSVLLIPSAGQLIPYLQAGNAPNRKQSVITEVSILTTFFLELGFSSSADGLTERFF